MAAKAAAAKTHTFLIVGNIYAQIAVEVDASDLESALTQARKLGFQDFVSTTGEVYDCNHKITGINLRDS